MIVPSMIEINLTQKILLTDLCVFNRNISLTVYTDCWINFALSLNIASNHVMSFSKIFINKVQLTVSLVCFRSYIIKIFKCFIGVSKYHRGIR